MKYLPKGLEAQDNLFTYFLHNFKERPSHLKRKLINSFNFFKVPLISCLPAPAGRTEPEAVSCDYSSHFMFALSFFFSFINFHSPAISCI